MFFRRSKNPSIVELGLRESTLERLNEVIGPARTGGSTSNTPPEPPPPATQPAAQVGQDPPVPIQTDAAVGLPVGSQHTPPSEAVAAAAPPQPDARLGAASDALQQTQEEVAELRKLLGAQQRVLETQVIAALARIDHHLETLDHTQQLVWRHLDAQAEALRELSNTVEVQQTRWAQYRSAVERLREITNAASSTVEFPANL